MTAFGKVFLLVLGAAVGLGLVLGGLVAALGPLVGLLAFLFLGFIYGWMLSAYLHYRQGRQVELVQLLTAAAKAGAPLAPALRAYLADRPRGPARAAWVAFLLFFGLPGYYWVWHRRHSYDRKVAAVADRLEQGASLHEALRETPGVVTRDTLLAVAVGESTGQLAGCLGGPPGGLLATVWV